MFKDEILFVFKRCEYNDNKILISKDVFFLSTNSSIIIIRSIKSIVKNELNENNFDMNLLKNISNRKKSILTLRIFKEKMIKKSDFINIAEIGVLIYYYLIRNKKNKLFSLIMNEIYDTLYELSSIKTI